MQTYFLSYLTLYAGVAELFTPKAAAESAACCNPNDHLLSCVSVKVNADIIFASQDNQDISFNDIKLSFSNPIDPHGKVYKNKQGDEAIINYSKETGDIIGSLRTHDGHSYELELCGDEGDYIFKEFDLTSDPDEGDDVEYRKDDVIGHAAHSLPVTAPDMLDMQSVSLHSEFGPPSEISVMVYYTPALIARRFNGNTQKFALWIDKVFAETNQAFKNSRINAKVVKFCQEEADIQERSADYIWSAFKRYKSRDGWTYPKLRNTADTAALFHSGSVCHICGVAELNGRISSTSYYAADTYFTYAHELGHNLGAEHDRLGRGRSDNHGHFLEGVPYRTILAYNRHPGPWRHTNRIEHFSNHDVRYNGVPTGVYGRTNNARTIRNNIRRASKWGNEKGTCKGERRTSTRRPRRSSTTRRPRITQRPRITKRTTTKRWSGRRTTTPRDYECLWGTC